MQDIRVLSNGDLVRIDSIREIESFVDIFDRKWKWSNVYRCFTHQLPYRGKGSLETQIYVPSEVLYLTFRKGQL